MSLKDYSTTAASNNQNAPNGWPEGMTMANVNNTGRQMMADVRQLAAADTIAAASTTDIGSKDATFLTLTGAATTINALGTVSAGIYKFIIYNAAHTLTNNATSLILLGGATRTVTAGSASLFVSEGSGNHRELMYMPNSSLQPLDATLTALAAALSAANKIPYATALDTLGELDFKDEDNMASDSATAVPSQQSVKAYADNLISSASAETPVTTADYFLFEDATDNTQKKALLSTIAPTHFASAETAIPAAGAKVDIAHSLSAVPRTVDVALRCIAVAGSAGYSQNDEVGIDCAMDGAARPSFMVVRDATNITLVSGDADANFWIHNKSTGTTTSIAKSTSDWKIVARAIK